MPPRPGGRHDLRVARVGRRRAMAAGLLLLFLAVALYFVFGLRDGGTDETASEPVVTTAPPQKILRIVFPEGFTRKEMVKRVAEVRQIAKTSAR